MKDVAIKIPFTIKTFLQKSGDFSKITLSNVQTSETGIFSSFDPESPLLESTYLPLTVPSDSIGPATISTFWQNALNSSLFYYYDDFAFQDFGSVKHLIPEEISIKKSGRFSTRFTFSSAGAKVKPYSYHLNTFLFVAEGKVDVVSFF